MFSVTCCSLNASASTNTFELFSVNSENRFSIEAIFVTMHKIIHNETNSSSSRRSCAFWDSNNCKSTFSLKSALARHLRRVCARKPLQCDRCRKRFAERAQGVAHRDRSGSVLQAVRFCMRIRSSTAATAADVRTLTFSTITAVVDPSQSQ